MIMPQLNFQTADKPACLVVFVINAFQILPAALVVIQGKICSAEVKLENL